MTEDFMLLMAVLITEAVRINGGPIEVGRSVIEAFDPYSQRVSIIPSVCGRYITIDACSAEIIEGEVVDTTD